MTKEKWRKIKRTEGTLYFKQHSTRKHGVKFDRYYRTEYQHNKKRIALNFGWVSDGWIESACFQKLKFFKKNAKAGKKPINFKQERAIEQEQERQKALKQYKNIKFKDFFEEIYFPDSKINKQMESWRKEGEHFKNWLNPEVGNMPINQISAFNLKKIKKNLMNAGRTPRTIQYVFATFRQVWNHARINDIVNDNSPTRKVKIPKIQNKRTRFLTPQEADLLLNKLILVSHQVHDMALLSLHTGMRAKEIFSLTCGVVDFNTDCISIRDSKGGSRFAYLTNATKKMLKDLCQGQNGSELVFQDRNGKRIKKISKSFFRSIEKLGFNNGVKDRRDKVVFHTMRHTFSSWHVQNGTDLYTVKELLGHSTIQLTERYSHLKPDGLKKSASTLEKYFNNHKEDKKIVNLNTKG